MNTLSVDAVELPDTGADPDFHRLAERVEELLSASDTTAAAPLDRQLTELLEGYLVGKEWPAAQTEAAGQAALQEFAAGLNVGLAPKEALIRAIRQADQLPSQAADQLADPAHQLEMALAGGEQVEATLGQVLGPASGQSDSAGLSRDFIDSLQSILGEGEGFDTALAQARESIQVIGERTGALQETSDNNGLLAALASGEQVEASLNKVLGQLSPEQFQVFLSEMAAGATVDNALATSQEIFAEIATAEQQIQAENGADNQLLASMASGADIAQTLNGLSAQGGQAELFQELLSRSLASGADIGTALEDAATASTAVRDSLDALQSQSAGETGQLIQALAKGEGLEQTMALLNAPGGNQQGFIESLTQALSRGEPANVAVEQAQLNSGEIASALDAVSQPGDPLMEALASGAGLDGVVDGLLPPAGQSAGQAELFQQALSQALAAGEAPQAAVAQAQQHVETLGDALNATQQPANELLLAMASGEALPEGVGASQLDEALQQETLPLNNTQDASPAMLAGQPSLALQTDNNQAETTAAELTTDQGTVQPTGGQSETTLAEPAPVELAVQAEPFIDNTAQEQALPPATTSPDETQQVTANLSSQVPAAEPQIVETVAAPEVIEGDAAAPAAAASRPQAAPDTTAGLMEDILLTMAEAGNTSLLPAEAPGSPGSAAADSPGSEPGDYGADATPSDIVVDDVTEAVADTADSREEEQTDESDDADEAEEPVNTAPQIRADLQIVVEGSDTTPGGPVQGNLLHNDLDNDDLDVVSVGSVYAGAGEAPVDDEITVEGRYGVLTIKCRNRPSTAIN